METQPSDDRAPQPPIGATRQSRRLPRGVWFAIALAIVVLAIAAFQATGSSSSTSSSRDQTDVIDPGLSDPTDSVNPLLPTAGKLIGTQAPDTHIIGFDGSPLTLSDFAGTPLVVNFWAYNCGPCRSEMPDLEKVHQEFGDRVTFLGVDTAESIDLGRPFAQETGVTYELASDPQGKMAAAFEATGLPTTVLIKADGTIVRIRNAGAVTADQLQGWIEQDLLS